MKDTGGNNKRQEILTGNPNAFVGLSVRGSEILKQILQMYV